MPSKKIVKKKSKQKKVLKRPPRLIVSKDGKKRYLKVGSKKVRVKSKLNNEQLIKVIVNNMTQPTKRRKPTSRKNKLLPQERKAPDVKAIKEAVSSFGTKSPIIPTPYYPVFNPNQMLGYTGPSRTRRDTEHIENTTIQEVKDKGKPEETKALKGPEKRGALTHVKDEIVEVDGKKVRVPVFDRGYTFADSPPTKKKKKKVVEVKKGKIGKEEIEYIESEAEKPSKIRTEDIKKVQKAFAKQQQQINKQSDDAKKKILEEGKKNKETQEKINQRLEEAENEAKRKLQEVENEAKKKVEEVKREAENQKVETTIQGAISYLANAKNKKMLKKQILDSVGYKGKIRQNVSLEDYLREMQLDPAYGEKLNAKLFSLGQKLGPNSTKEGVFKAANVVFGKEKIPKSSKKQEEVKAVIKETTQSEIPDEEIELVRKPKKTKKSAPESDSGPSGVSFRSSEGETKKPAPLGSDSGPSDVSFRSSEGETKKSESDSLSDISITSKSDNLSEIPITDVDLESNNEERDSIIPKKERPKKSRLSPGQEAVLDFLKEDLVEGVVRELLPGVAREALEEEVKEIDDERQMKEGIAAIAESTKRNALNALITKKTGSSDEEIVRVSNSDSEKESKKGSEKEDFSDLIEKPKTKDKKKQSKLTPYNEAVLDVARENITEEVVRELLPGIAKEALQEEEENFNERKEMKEAQEAIDEAKKIKDRETFKLPSVTINADDPDEEFFSGDERDQQFEGNFVIDLDPDSNDLTGFGKNKGGGLYDYQIDRIMKPFNKDGFAGVIASDEIHKLPAKKRMGFVMNLDKSNKPGSHWVAVYIDADKDKSIEYYDSYGNEPPKSFMKQIKLLVNKIKPDSYLKFKVNKIVDQRANSDTCGWFSSKFLIDRFNGVPFKDTTGFSNVTKGEKNIKIMKKKYEEFGLI